MSVQDRNPADSARPVTPLFFYGDDLPEDVKDWRPKPVPADAPEEPVVPKDSAPAPVSDSESPTPTVEEPNPETPAQPPVETVDGPPKVTNLGKQSSSRRPTTPGA